MFEHAYNVAATVDTITSHLDIVAVAARLNAGKPASQHHRYIHQALSCDRQSIPHNIITPRVVDIVEACLAAARLPSYNLCGYHDTPYRHGRSRISEVTEATRLVLVVVETLSQPLKHGSSS